VRMNGYMDKLIDGSYWSCRVLNMCRRIIYNDVGSIFDACHFTKTNWINQSISKATKQATSL